MKSFTRNPANLPGLRADKRFDALVKKQEEEHTHLLSAHHKEMQDLRDNLNLAMERSKSLSELNATKLDEFHKETRDQFKFLKEIVVSQDRSLLDQKKSIEDLHGRLLEFQTLYASCREIEKMRKDLETQIRETTVSHLVSLQTIQREFKDWYYSLKDDLSKFKWDAESKFCALVESIEKNFNVTKIDREGVLKEIRIYEKTIFIIEKKIENLYTLIERINKREESCPRQA